MLRHELEKERRRREEEDRRRQGLSSLITYLKKVNKEQIRKVQDAEVCDRALPHLNKYCL